MAEEKQQVKKKRTSKKGKIGMSNRRRRMFIAKMAIVVTLVVLQIILSIWVYSALEQYVVYWRTGALLLSIGVVLYIVNGLFLFSLLRL